MSFDSHLISTRGQHKEEPNTNPQDANREAGNGLPCVKQLTQWGFKLTSGTNLGLSTQRKWIQTSIQLFMKRQEPRCPLWVVMQSENHSALKRSCEFCSASTHL